MFSTIREIIADANAGKMFILLDDEHRENEGDLVVFAQHSTPEAINFMMQKACGLVYLAIHQTIADKLQLTLQPKRHTDEISGTAFTTSIEARNGITSGTSAHDRAQTILTAVHPDATHDDIMTPGHIFPIVAHSQGLNARQGHTEAVIEIAQLAGATPAAVGCELIRDDGRMARTEEIFQFAKQHGLKVATIEDLIKYKES
jgi:3,4-dihydroxy-2-butanone 4-phosphate synthase